MGDQPNSSLPQSTLEHKRIHIQLMCAFPTKSYPNSDHVEMMIHKLVSSRNIINNLLIVNEGAN
ncbi:hypothetical protein AWQ14_20695 [Vibrio parahaemolyticus]|nr:hypothetical protein AWQ14_20695 [Vibrio parahaemolyticus]OKY50146.1 hypothetical protein BUL36_12020 [Vibrio parahaemolyticus]